MLRPPSIVTFERCYLGAWALGVVNTALNWSAVQNNPDIAAANAQIGSWYMPLVTGLGFVIPLILWYFIARRGSVVAKWIMVVLTGLGAIGLVLSAIMGRFPAEIGAIISVVTVALNIFAASRLFRPDALPWFGESSSEPL